MFPYINISECVGTWAESIKVSRAKNRLEKHFFLLSEIFCAKFWWPFTKADFPERARVSPAVFSELLPNPGSLSSVQKKSITAQ